MRLLTRTAPKKGNKERRLKEPYDQRCSPAADVSGMKHGTRPTAQRTPVYGILALGRRVRFLYRDATQTIKPWRPGNGWAPGHGGREYYLLEQEAAWVQRALRDILNNY
ncbi:hypothetical protein CFD26_100781 [Aspergillus turcosus]|uniref:Uncharacterized protein n=1 Tax=Aspergillus turcosus TaxID=1245748 RepID=A0A3R7J2V7_9EURO|nr:hypothetical protein CFD26_100781 [Aspergillus turcosus]